VIAPGPGFHLAFIAPSREAVDAFHAAALAAGAEDCGAPGPRPHYGETYYAAFVIDLDGYKLEAVHQ
jgi:catechol 2,3-dioxygenase-like lactoylglutathione lyase family enzyme